jgi:hypothetical protein
MAKIISPANQVAAVHDKIMQKITGKINLAKNESVITAWRFGNRPIHAGQICGKKVLPNGNTQIRITTAYAGDATTIATDTKVYSPSGELLKAYHGIRGNRIACTNEDGVVTKVINETRAYSSEPNEIAQIVQNERRMNPDIKTL